jgi:hypothetical protein
MPFMRPAPPLRKGKAMSKKTIKKTTKPLSSRPVVEQADTAFVIREDLDDEQEPLKPITDAGAADLNAQAPEAAAEQPPAAATVSSKPFAPLAALWPDPVPPKEEAKPSQPPAPQIQKPSTAVTASKPTPHGS